jgi:hypothetical protein
MGHDAGELQVRGRLRQLRNLDDARIAGLEAGAMAVRIDLDQ